MGQTKDMYIGYFTQDIGDRTEVTLGTYVGGNVGFIGCEELVLTDGRGV